MPDPKNVTEEMTLGELREQLQLLNVIALRLGPPGTIVGTAMGEEGVAASVHHATGFYIGMGPTEAAAIEAAFVKLRHVLLPESLRRYLQELEEKSTAPPLPGTLGQGDLTKDGR